MGGQQTKSKHRKGEQMSEEHDQDVRLQCKPVKSVWEGTSVDVETESLRKEGLHNSDDEEEENLIEQPTENIMSGLPGEIVPVSEVFIPLEEEDSTINVLEHTENFIEKTSVKENNNIVICQVQDVPSECESPKVSETVTDNIKYNSGNVSVGRNIRYKDIRDVGPVVTKYYTEVDSFKTDMGEENEELKTDTFNSLVTHKDLQDIKVARENFELPLQLDLNGNFRKKVTSENDDNRCVYNTDGDNFDHDSIMKPIFTNVIFLPDKSKGASPKRYGPKRLGSIYDGISDENYDDDNSSELTADNKSIGNVSIPQDFRQEANIDNEAERKLKRDNVISSAAKERVVVEDSCRERSKENEEKEKSLDGKHTDPVNGTENLFFVDDHFGLYTGTMAEGISKDFKEEGKMKHNENELSHTEPSHTVEEDNKENKSFVGSMADTVPHDLQRLQQIFEKKENVDRQQLEGTEGNSNSRSLSLPTSKCEHVHEFKSHKSKEKETIKVGDLLEEQEVVDICRFCKEPRDLCPCLFPGMNTVMTVLYDYQKKPTLSYLRYLKINDKEVNWSILKSAQAIFIKRIKSHNTAIFEDNRVAFKFELPSCKGFFGPSQRHEIIEKEVELNRVSDCNSGKSLVSSIESRYGFDICGVNPTGSISSYRNIIVNDFDECSDADDEFSETDKESYASDERQCKNSSNGDEKENVIKGNTYIGDEENKKMSHDKTVEEVTVKALHDEIGSLADDEESGFENDLLIEKELICVQRQEHGKFERDTCNCLDQENELNMQMYSHDKGKDCTDKSNTLGNSDNFEQLLKEKSKESLNSNKCNLYLQRNERKMEPVIVKHVEGDSSKFFNKEIVSNGSHLEAFDLFPNKKIIALNNRENKCDPRADDCDLKRREHVFKTHGNKVDECAERRNKINETQVDVKSDLFCLKEDNDISEAFQSDEGNKFVTSFSSSMVKSTGNKFSGNNSMEISRNLKTEIETIKDTNVQADDDRSVLKDHFFVENKTVEANPEYLERFLLDDKFENLNSLSSELSVVSLEFQEKNDCETSIKGGDAVLSEALNTTEGDLFVENLDKDVNIEIVDSDNNNLADTKLKTNKMHLTGGLRRKCTKIEEDNRYVNISSDDEEKVNQNELLKTLKEEVQLKNAKKNPVMDDKEERIVIPTPDGSEIIAVIRKKVIGMSTSSDGVVPSSFLSSSNTRSSSTGIELPGNLLGEFMSSSDLDFSLPPDKFMKQLQERNPGYGGMLGHLITRMNGGPKDHHREHTERRPQRPENAKSDFAASFYDSYDRNVDITQLDSQPESFQNQSNDSDAERRRRNSLERIAGERIVEELESRSSSKSSSFSKSVLSSRSASPVCFESSEDEGVTEVKLNDMWNQLLQDEKNTCLQRTRIPASYRCTVLCIDVSGSMQGLPWQHVEQFILEFLSGLEEKKQSENIEEFVAMVTFGYKTKIVTQPSKNYTQLHKDFKSLKPEGNSPLLPGIALSLLIQTVRREFGQRYCKLHDIIVNHRIILLSDGRPTPMSLVCTSDNIPDLIHQEACQEVDSSLQEWKLPSQYSSIDCVPVGSNPNLDMLETICRITNGRLVKPSGVQDLVNSTHNHYIAAQISKQMFQDKVETFDEQMFKTLVLSLYPTTSPTDMAEMINKVEGAQTRLLAKQAQMSDSMSDPSEEDTHFEPKDLQDLPQIGVRVVPGPDVTGRLLQMDVQKGTITGHSRKHRGKVYVLWNNGVNTLCDCGYNNKFEVFLADDTEQYKVDDKIKVGYKVRRGPDWKYGDQDGGVDKLGTVIKIYRNGNLLVKWPNGNRNKYRYKQCGIFDVLISDPMDPFGRQIFESEMNKRNQERTCMPVQMPDETSDKSQFSVVDIVDPKSSENECLRSEVLVKDGERQKSENDSSVRPKMSGDNSVRSKISSDNSVRPKSFR